MMNQDECDVKWQDRLTMFMLALVLLVTAAAMIGSSKKKQIINDIEELDMESIIIHDKGPLPEILPPLFEEPLPPLQGEVE